MKLRIGRAAAAFLLLCSLAASAPAQERRVRFERGRTSAVIKGTISHGREIVYVLGARAGQTLIVHVSTSSSNHDVVFSIKGPGGDLTDDIGTDFSGELPRSGDYRIAVGAIESESANFTLEVTIR
jgi:hypothetical protein